MMTFEEYWKKHGELNEIMCAGDTKMFAEIVWMFAQRKAGSGDDNIGKAVQHLTILHRVLYGTIDNGEALAYLYEHLRDDADLADMGRPLKYQYKEDEG